MSQNEKLVVGLLGGLLAFLVAMFFGASIIKVLEVLFEVLLIGVYLRWLYVKRRERHWLPPAILLIILLLTALIDVHVFREAEVVGYSRDEGWISEMVYYSPEYAGEYIPLFLVVFAPLLGLTGLWIMVQQKRKLQFVHYLALLVTVYPAFAFLTFHLVEGNLKPRFYEGTARPPIGTKHVRNDTKW